MENNESIKKVIDDLCLCHDELIHGDIQIDNRMLSHLIDLCNIFVDDYYKLQMDDGL